MLGGFLTEFLNHQQLGGGFKHFFIFTPKIGEMMKHLTSIFFGWVGKNHQLGCITLDIQSYLP